MSKGGRGFAFSHIVLCMLMPYLYVYIYIYIYIYTHVYQNDMKTVNHAIMNICMVYFFTINTHIMNICMILFLNYQYIHIYIYISECMIA